MPNKKNSQNNYSEYSNLSSQMKNNHLNKNIFNQIKTLKVKITMIKIWNTMKTISI